MASKNLLGMQLAIYIAVSRSKSFNSKGFAFADTLAQYLTKLKTLFGTSGNEKGSVTKTVMAVESQGLRPSCSDCKLFLRLLRAKTKSS